MAKKLSVLIPTYKEPEYMLKRLLDSIALQQHVDFKDIEVLVESDGDENTYEDDFFASYPYDVNYYIGNKRGVSATRNDLLDNAKGEYIIWCDADDYWCSTLAFHIILREIRIGGFDALFGNFIQESPVPNTTEDYMFMEMKTGGQQFVHNKTYRRKFLIDNDIRFCEKSNIHEDCVIATLSKVYTQNIKYNPTPTYMWAWNPDSVCRRDPYYLQHTLKNLLMSQAYIIQKLLKRGRNDAVRECAFSILVDVYYSLNEKKWLEDSTKGDRDETEGYFKYFYSNYKKYIDELGEDKKNQIIAGQKMLHTQQGVLFETITFDAWLRHIEVDVEEIDFNIENLFDKA